MCDKEPVKYLHEFTERVRIIREYWGMEPHKELLFRGENKDYGDGRLRPKLYRTTKGKTMKPIDDILDIEDDLFQRFWREGSQYYTPRSDSRYEDWDFYILMQHHGAPTRLLDWTESAFTALHFAIKAIDSDKSNDQDNNSTNPCVYVLESYRLYDKVNFLILYRSRNKSGINI